jgi:hypothetical protein
LANTTRTIERELFEHRKRFVSGAARRHNAKRIASHESVWITLCALHDRIANRQTNLVA